MTRKFVRVPVEEYHALLTHAGLPIPAPRPRAKPRPVTEPWRTIFTFPLEAWRDAAPPEVRDAFSRLAVKVTPEVLAEAIMAEVDEDRHSQTPVTLEAITRRLYVANGGWA